VLRWRAPGARASALRIDFDSIAGGFKRFNQNLIAAFSLFLLATFFAGCIAAVPVIIYYAAADDGDVATAEVNENADELWQSTTQLADKRVEEKKEEELALRIMKELCANAKADC